jgi:hypothetical protein
VRRTSKIATAYHEAGHAVMCWHYGARIRKLTIVPGADFTGSCHHERIVCGRYPEADNSNRTRSRLEKLAAIALAGPIAQQIHAPRTFRNYHASSDYSNALNAALTANGSEDEAEAWVSWIEIRTTNQIQRLWPIVENTAKALLRCETLNEQQIQTAIHDALGNNPRRVVLDHEVLVAVRASSPRHEHRVHRRTEH